MWENHVIGLLMGEEDRALSLTPRISGRTSVSGSTQLNAQLITLTLPFKHSCKHGDTNSLAEEIYHFFESGKDSILLTPGKKNQTTFDALSILKSGTITIF